MPNQTVNKVQFGNQTVMDITDTTADAADVIQGEVFYTKSGVRSTGTLGDATQSTHGLMSAADKAKLDSITGNVYTDYTITIAVADWTASNGSYVYTWTNAAVTTQCLADVIFITDPDTVLAGLSLSADKVTGGMQFVCDGTPSGALTVKIRIIDSDTTAIQQNATTTQDGFMTAQDKVKLDAVYQASAYHESDMGTVETTNTATHAISAGQYVIWKGQLYTADSAITVGATLAASGGSKNLTAVSNGGFNALNNNLNNKIDDIVNPLSLNYKTESAFEAALLTLLNSMIDGHQKNVYPMLIESGPHMAAETRYMGILMRNTTDYGVCLLLHASRNPMLIQIDGGNFTWKTISTI